MYTFYKYNYRIKGLSMLTHEEMIGLQAEKGDIINPNDFKTKEEYVLHLIHSFAYIELSKTALNKRVLDLGCNMGYGSEILSRTAKKVIGVDVSEKAINSAKRQYYKQNIDFQTIDGKKLPFEDNSFDIIISCQVIEHIVDYTDYLDEIKRVLKPSGTAFLTTPNAYIRLDLEMKPWNIFHVREYKHSELKSVLDKYFTSVKIMGLSAKKHLYLVERHRVTMARNAAREKQAITLKSLIKKIIPKSVLDLRTSINSSKQNRDNNKPFDKTYSIDDLFYKTDNLDDALDFLAICSKEKSNFKEIGFI